MNICNNIFDFLSCILQQSLAKRDFYGIFDLFFHLKDCMYSIIFRNLYTKKCKILFYPR